MSKDHPVRLVLVFDRIIVLIYCVLLIYPNVKRASDLLLVKSIGYANITPITFYT